MQRISDPGVTSIAQETTLVDLAAAECRSTFDAFQF